MILPRKIYFLGIGGIGMSALARYFNKRGVEIHGYDKTKTKLTAKLESEGMLIHYHEDISLIPSDCDLIIRTPAIPQDSIEYNFLVQNNFNIKKRSEVLGDITSTHKNIAIAGTHGKTTTSALVSHILYSNQIKLNAFLGGILSNYASNYLDSGDDWMIEEADEYDRSFLFLHPDIAVINSLDADHLDIYQSHQLMIDSYLRFASNIKQNGLLLLSSHISDEHYKLFCKAIHPSVVILRFGGSDLDFYSTINSTDQGLVTFDYHNSDSGIQNLSMLFPGQHNVENATVGIFIALQLGLNESQIKLALQNFKGINRRFEILYNSNGKVLIDDYAHHPTELAAAIATAKNSFPGRKILGIFQPHLYSRTRDFYQQFGHVLSDLDQVILLDIYPARELPMEGINSQLIAKEINKNVSCIICSKQNLIGELQRCDIELVLVLGAGDIDTCVPDILQLLKDKDE